MRAFFHSQLAPRAARADATSRSVARALAISLALTAWGCHGPQGPRVFISNEDGGTITVVDAQSFRVIDTVRVGQRPRGLHVSRDGQRLYVALSGSPRGGPGVDEARLPPPNRAADGIGVVELGDLSLARTIESGQDPESFDLIDDHTLVVSNEETAEASVVDTETRKLRGRIPVGREPEGVAIAPDHTAWVTSETDDQVAVIAPDEGAVVATIATGARPRGVAFTADGKRALITNENDASLTVADVATRRPTGRIAVPADRAAPSPPRPMGIAIARDGHRAYVTTGRAGSVAVLDLDAATPRVVATIAGVGKRPWGIAIAPSGLVFTANGPSNDVSVIDPATSKVIARIQAGGSPWGVAIAP